MQHWTCSALLRYKISDFFRSLLGIYWSISGWLSHHDWGLFRILIRIVGAVSLFLLSFLFIRKAFNVPGLNAMEKKILKTVTVAIFILAAVYTLVALRLTH